MSKNLENLVSKTISQLIDSRDRACKCESCHRYLIQRVMENLPLKYQKMVSGSGQVYPEYQSEQTQLTANVLTQCMQAINEIEMNPRH
ncbi:MAG: late competence development ComFB family protein [bacterium]